MKISKLTLLISTTIILIAISFSYLTLKTKRQVKELFRMNKSLQEEGYYMQGKRMIFIEDGSIPNLV